MIRFYAYYSVGGYKDFYLGNSLESASSTYLLPLLGQLLESKDPRKRAKGEQQLELSKIEPITLDDNHGMPNECLRLFTHGGYRAMYLDIRAAGCRCFIVRDLNNGARDEEGRAVPFVLVMVAEGVTDVLRLDSFAIRYCSEMSIIDSRLGTLLGYDGIQNGIRFDIRDCLELIDESQPISFLPTDNEVKYMVVGSLELATIVCKELDFDQKDVECILNNEGEALYGKLETFAQNSLTNNPKEFIAEADVEISSESDKRVEIVESKEDKFEENTSPNIDADEKQGIEPPATPESPSNTDHKEELTENHLARIEERLKSIEARLASITQTGPQRPDDAIEERLKAIESQMASLSSGTQKSYNKVLQELETLKSINGTTVNPRESIKEFWKDPKVWLIIGAIGIATLILLIA